MSKPFGTWSIGTSFQASSASSCVSEPIAELDGLVFAHDGATVLDQFDLTVNRGEVVALLGPSGAGKTSILRLIAGLEHPARGQIKLRDVTVSGHGKPLPPEQRRLAMVQQEFALFPHLDVAANVAFGLHQQTPKERSGRVTRWLRQVGLSDKSTRFPHQLSGGEQQRVAIARALATAPDLLLLDEPFSGLDAQLRDQLTTELRDWLKQANVAAVLVTHDQSEAFRLADRVGVLRHGVLQQIGTASDLLRSPANRFVADFLGQGSWLPLAKKDGAWSCSLLASAVINDDASAMELLLRHHDLQRDAQGIAATVTQARPIGNYLQCLVTLPDDVEVTVRLPSYERIRPGETIRVSRDPNAPIIAFPRPQLSDLPADQRSA